MEKSIVEYFSVHEGYRCGYCKSTDGSYSHGMWAHIMTPSDYQNLIDRGWRRSGKYCYKPTMDVTCCPMYTIRCEAKKFIPTKSQKKVLKKVHKFLAYGSHGKISHAGSSENLSDHEMDISDCPREIDIQTVKNIKVKSIDHQDITSVGQTSEKSPQKSDEKIPLTSAASKSSEPKSPQHSSNSNPPSLTDSPSKTINTHQKCRKAKVIRQERKLQKLLKMGKSPEEAAASIKKKVIEPKSIEDFLNEPMPEKPAHKLELRLVPSCAENSLFSKTFQESYAMYKKYQMTIHKDPSEKCSSKQFLRFLVTSPFQNYEAYSRENYGSFHQHYLLDGKIIAVGVIDILPNCISSVYFYYDPDYSFLSLGTYAALREIAFTREMNKKDENIQYYYMGYYIHSCVKMSYKGQFVPSSLLCPEIYNFHPIAKCKPKLDSSKYHRLEEDTDKTDSHGNVNIDDVIILYNRKQMKYPVYRHFKKNSDDQEEVEEYAKFVGPLCYSKMLLYRS